MAGDPVLLSRLAEVAATTQNIVLEGGDATMIDLDHDSRNAGPGVGFIAVPGSADDGHRYVDVVVAAGSPALVVEHPVDAAVPQLVVEATRPLMAVLAAEVHHHPASAMRVVGVTGTNGKTTVTHMLEAIVLAAGGVPGLVGTVGARIAGRHVALRHTTPEATELQRLLHRMVDERVDTVAMEVSSHALAFGRADAIRFDVAAFTNLSQDHLDFHGDMGTYFAVKGSLFGAERSELGVVCIDDEWGRALARSIEIPLVTVTAGAAAGADIAATDVVLGPASTRFTLVVDGVATTSIDLKLGGRFNVANALVAAACALDVGVDLGAIALGLSGLAGVPGRFETVDAGQPFTVVVDYAHTPDAIRTVIEAARSSGRGRVIVVGGAGGDRDATKRPAMGAALAGADVTILTSDNPRSEDPLSILSGVQSGIRRGAGVVVEPDRRIAIRTAVGEAAPGDVVLILGKGHETGQQIGADLLPFDDRLVAMEELTVAADGGDGSS